jgi:hypothetical protein
VLLIFIFYGCSRDKDACNENDKTITFNKEQSIDFSESNIFENKKIVPLETTDNSLIPAYPSLIIDGDNFFIFNKNSNKPIFRFNSHGDFINKIGSIGNGPNEYAELIDVTINPSNKYIEVLTSNNVIQQYAYDGMPLAQINITIPAFSFANVNNEYWIYTGNNKVYSPYRLFHSKDGLNSFQAYLTDDSNILPLMENNFGGNVYLTFWESLYPKTYKIMGDSLYSYTIKFPGLNIPPAVHTKSAMEVIPYLQQLHYASIRTYFENATFIYFLIYEVKGKEIPVVYHWIINKDDRNETVIKQTNVEDDSYTLHPQLLTKDNLLYFIGNPVENKFADFDSNPMIVIVDIAEAWNFVQNHKPQ